MLLFFFSIEIQALSATLSSIQYNFVFGESSRLFAITAPLNLDKTLQVQVGNTYLARFIKILLPLNLSYLKVLAPSLGSKFE